MEKERNITREEIKLTLARIRDLHFQATLKKQGFSEERAREEVRRRRQADEKKTSE